MGATDARKRTDTMRETEIIDYTKRLMEAHGDKAEAEAAQKTREFELQKDAEQAEVWRRIRTTIRELRGSSAV
jgi:hypothetical protein